MDAVSPALIHGEGTPEPVWLAWLSQLPNMPVRPLSAMAPAGSRLVVVAPHPDDEILACGGLLAACVQQGTAVCVVALTDGDASHGTSDPQAMRTLAAVRCHESANGLSVLGVAGQDVLRWHLPDGQLRHHQRRITALLGGLLTAHDVVLTTWCADGHPDHEAAGEAVVHACELAGCQWLQAPVWMWHWAVPGDGRVPWSEMVSWAVPTELVAMKSVALQCHHSQLSSESGQAPILGAAICDRAQRTHEYFFTGGKRHAS